MLKRSHSRGYSTFAVPLHLAASPGPFFLVQSFNSPQELKPSLSLIQVHVIDASKTIEGLKENSSNLRKLTIFAWISRFAGKKVRSPKKEILRQEYNLILSFLMELYRQKVTLWMQLGWLNFPNGWILWRTTIPIWENGRGIAMLSRIIGGFARGPKVCLWLWYPAPHWYSTVGVIYQWRAKRGDPDPCEEWTLSVRLITEKEKISYLPSIERFWVYRSHFYLSSTTVPFYGGTPGDYCE